MTDENLVDIDSLNPSLKKVYVYGIYTWPAESIRVTYICFAPKTLHRYAVCMTVKR